MSTDMQLAGLGWFLISIRRKSRGKLRTKTRLCRLIDEIGRWSNADVRQTVASLQQALKELSDAARSIRSPADYLDQHPEALIRGR